VFADTVGHDFMVFAQVQERRDDFKAWLALKQSDGWRVLVRLESHGNHPGVHVHDWCGVVNPPFGGQSIAAPYRRPKARNKHRRKLDFNRATFWDFALAHFRVTQSHEQGELL